MTSVEPPPEPARDLAPADGLGEYPAWNGIDLDCKDVHGPVRVTGPDPHRLDQDGNGIGCEG
jgi:micrococcal nuclease